VEGDAWHWRWFVPHDPEGLISLFSSKQKFVNDLSNFFSLSNLDPFNILPNPYYWAGNEPDIFAGWLFAFAGRPDLTQEYIRMVMATRYSSDVDGLPGNDDYGTMSAWYVFASLGFYPQSGGPKYIMGSPIFDKVVLNITTSTYNTTLTILAHNPRAPNIYVQKVSLNGELWKTPFFNHSQLFSSKGVTLEFFMGDKKP